MTFPQQGAQQKMKLIREEGNSSHDLLTQDHKLLTDETIHLLLWVNVPRLLEHYHKS